MIAYASKGKSTVEKAKLLAEKQDLNHNTTIDQTVQKFVESRLIRLRAASTIQKTLPNTHTIHWNVTKRPETTVTAIQDALMLHILNTSFTNPLISAISECSSEGLKKNLRT